jgi:hypothetical protein
MLRVNHALNTDAPKSYESYAGYSSETELKVLNICKIAFDALFEDTKLLVEAGVRADIAHRKATASSREELSKASSRGELRESGLKSWIKEPFPLAYGRQSERDVFTHLLHAVSPDENSVCSGLPNWENFATSPSKFSMSLFNMSSPDRPSRPEAPVVEGGSFLPVLKVVHKALIDLSNHPDKEAQNAFVVGAFKKSLREFKVHFFPASKLKTGTAGAPHRRPLYNSWGYLGHKDETARSSLRGGPSRPAVTSEEAAFNDATANDFNVAWSANTLNMINLQCYLRKVSLPRDFTLPTLTSVPYVDNTYQWVKDNYDGTKPLHHLGLLVGIIVSSSLLPNLFMPTGKMTDFLYAHSKDDVRRAYNKLDWLPKDGRRGMSDHSIFIAMYTTFIIAIYEKDSPLRMHMSEAPRGGLGDAWTKKHSKRLLFFFLKFRSHRFSL